VAEFRRLGLLVLIMTAIAIAIGGGTILLLYDVAFDQQRQRLINIVQSQARLAEAVARFDARYSLYPDGPRMATLTQIREAHEQVNDAVLGRTGRLWLAERIGDRIVYILRRGPDGSDQPLELPWDSPVAEPMRRALSGQSGSMVALAVRGVRVLAAYEPVAILNLGMVANIDVEEIRAPFMRAASIIGLVGCLLIGLGIVLFFAISESTIRTLRESEQRFRELINHMRGGVAIYEAVDGGKDFRFKDLNRAGERSERLRRDDVVGRTLSEIYPQAATIGLISTLQEVWLTGEPAFLPATFYQDQRISGWRENYVYKLANGDVVALFYDVTESKSIEGALRESEARYRLLFDQSPNPILIIDPVTTLPLQFNKAAPALLEYTSEEFRTVDIAGFEAKEKPEMIRDHIAAMLERGGDEFETLWRTKSGGVLHVFVNCRVVELSGQRVLHAVVTDITERVLAARRVRDLQDQLIQVARVSELGQMTSALAHELNQPLAAAMNYINALRRLIESSREPVPPAAIELAQKGTSQIERAGSILHGLRQFAKPKAMERTIEDINQVVEEASELALLGVDRNIVQSRFRLAEGLPKVSILRIPIQQVLLNLIRNAIEAMADSERRILFIDTTPAGAEWVKVAIGDTGIGLEDEIRDRLFQPFVTTKSDGMGMGLSICRSIIDSHGGRLWVEDNNWGGTTFHFTVPIASSPADKPEPGALVTT
jgi:two-component system sensor kinase FixL